MKVDLNHIGARGVGRFFGLNLSRFWEPLTETGRGEISIRSFYKLKALPKGGFTPIF